MTTPCPVCDREPGDTSRNRFGGPDTISPGTPLAFVTCEKCGQRVCAECHHRARVLREGRGWKMTTATKEKPILFSGPMVRALWDGRKTQTRRTIPDRVLVKWTGREEHHVDLVNMAKYRRGDRIWVRESFCRTLNNWLYRADFPAGEKPQDNTDEWDWPTGQINRWSPSIHLPREGSRLTLEVTDVRAERVRKISPDDAVSEGVSPRECEWPTEAFERLWIDIHGVESWASNPWVWAYTFKVVSA